MAFRGIAQRWHRWLGLSIGLWFAFLGLSGAVLVFWHALEDQAYPATMAVTPGDALPLETLLERLLAARPEADIYRIQLADAPGAAIRLDFFDTRPGTEDVFRATAYMNPVSGGILGERVFGGAWINTLYSLHSGLILGRPGIVVAGLVGLALGALTLMGLALWRYRDGRALRESIAPVQGLRGLRRLRNWHRALGLWAVLPLVLTAITGAGLAFPETVRELSRPLLGEPEASLHAGPTTAGLAAAIIRAEELLPGQRAIWIDLPLPESKAPTSIILRPADGSLSGPGVVEFGMAFGKQMSVTQASPVETLRAWIMALHNGQTLGGQPLGMAHRLFIVALGMVPLALAGLGWAAWRRRVGNRSRGVAPHALHPESQVTVPAP